MQMLRDWQDPCIQAIREAIEHIKGNSYLSTYKGEIFLVMSGWDEVHKIDEYLKKAYSYLDEDISVDFVMKWNCGFDDEYCQCFGCGSIIQTSPDSYSWTPDYELNEEGIFCLECIDFDSYINYRLNNPNNANTIYSEDDFTGHGFKLYSDAGEFESGWYGCNDSPPAILKEMQSKFPNVDFVFSICGSGQFATQFDIWGRERDLEQD